MDTGNINVLGKLTASILDKHDVNIVLNAFRIAINGNLTQLNMVDGIVDEYQDESAIDTGASTNERYDSVDNFYTPDGGLPTEEYTSDANTQLLLHCNGTDTSTSFPDSGNTGHTVTANGNAQVDTSFKQFGTGSLLLDGTGDYLSIPDSEDWNMGDGTFTIDFWVRFNALPTSSNIVYFVSQEDDTNNRWSITSYIC